MPFYTDASSRPLRCLVVDDEASLRSVIRRALALDGMSCLEAESGLDALRTIVAEHRTDSPVDLVLSDYHMPGMSGGALVREIRSRWPDISVVMITSVSEISTALRCIDDGALDYVNKPFSPCELRGRVRQAIEKRRLLAENERYRANLEERVVAQAGKYEQLFHASLQALADALEVKDAYTAGHSARVASYAVAIAHELDVSEAMCEQIELGSRLHDIGKIGVRESVLNKEGRLTSEEYQHVMEHPVIGWRLLSPIMHEMPHALAIVRWHHERLDGLGGPDGLTDERIPLEARIAAVADSFDAMTSGRSYRDGMSAEQALAELRRCVGTQFCRECVNAFASIIERGAISIPGYVTRWTNEFPAIRSVA